MREIHQNYHSFVLLDSPKMSDLNDLMTSGLLRYKILWRVERKETLQPLQSCVTFWILPAPSGQGANQTFWRDGDLTDVPTKLGLQCLYHILIRCNWKVQFVLLARCSCQRWCRLCCDPIVQRPKQQFRTWARQYAETATRKLHPKAPRHSLNSTGVEAPAVGTAAASFLTSFLRCPNEDGVPCLWCCKARWCWWDALIGKITGGGMYTYTLWNSHGPLKIRPAEKKNSSSHHENVQGAILATRNWQPTYNPSLPNTLWGLAFAAPNTSWGCL